MDFSDGPLMQQPSGICHFMPDGQSDPTSIKMERIPMQACKSRLMQCSSDKSFLAKVFTQCCVINRDLQSTESCDGCSFKCLRRECLFFFSWAFLGHDLVLPSQAL